VYGSVKQSDAKRFVLKIQNSRGADERLPHYKNLIRMAKKLEKELPSMVARIAAKAPETARVKRQLEDIVAVSELLPHVISQTERRVIRGESVPAEEKIASIFELHTDIIVKGRREVEYGHKAFFTSGKSGLVLDCQLVQGNPADTEYFIDLIEEQKSIYGRVPRQVSVDGGFASEDNLYDAKDLGVKDVCFSKTCGLPVEEMCKSEWVFQKLRNFRAGIEATISVLKRAFGLGRALWKGVKGFGAYVHSAVAAYNLTILARLQLQS
jgi:IS5 family transposase